MAPGARRNWDLCRDAYELLPGPPAVEGRLVEGGGPRAEPRALSGRS